MSTLTLYNSAKLNRLGTWNARGINGTSKKEEVVDVFREGKFELLALMETIQREWSSRYHGVEQMASLLMSRRWKEVAILLNDVWYSAVIDFGCVSSRILWIKFKFSRVK